MRKLLITLLLMFLNGCLYHEMVPQNLKQLTDGYCVIQTDEDRTAYVRQERPYCVRLGKRFHRQAPETKLFIMAHEIQHVNDLRMGVYPTERVADWFGGCLLGYTNMDLSPVVYWLVTYTRDDEQHPPREERIQIIAQAKEFCSHGQ